MKKSIVALALCLMSATAIFAENNRQTTAQLPASTPSVSLTIDGKAQTVKPTKVQIMEVDSAHVRCTVFAGKDKASVKLPVSYDNLLYIALRAASVANSCNLISDEEMQKINDWMAAQTGAQF